MYRNPPCRAFAPRQGDFFGLVGLHSGAGPPKNPDGFSPLGEFGIIFRGQCACRLAGGNEEERQKPFVGNGGCTEDCTDFIQRDIALWDVLFLGVRISYFGIFCISP